MNTSKEGSGFDEKKGYVPLPTNQNPFNKVSMSASEHLNKKKNDCYIILNEMFIAVEGSTSIWVELDKLAEAKGIIGFDFEDAYTYLRNENLIRLFGAQYTSFITDKGIEWLSNTENNKKKDSNKQPTTIINNYHTGDKLEIKDNINANIGDILQSSSQKKTAPKQEANTLLLKKYWWALVVPVFVGLIVWYLTKTTTP